MKYSTETAQDIWGKKTWIQWNKWPNQVNINKCYCLSGNKKIVNLGKKCLWIVNISWFLTQHLFPNVWLLLSTENFVQLTIFSPHFLSASEKTDITQVPEVGVALLKANKCNAIHFSVEFGLEKEAGVHQYMSLVLVLRNLFRGSHMIFTKGNCAKDSRPWSSIKVF